MLAKRWGVFLCDCRSTLNMDLQKIGNPASLVVVATNPEKDIEDFASKADQLELEHVVVGCCAKPSIFEEALQGKTLHFLDLKGKCFAPHSNIEQAHTKASKMIEAEIRVSNIKAKNPVPVNPLQVGNRVVIFTEFSEGLKLASMLDELMDGDSAAVTLCISSDIEGLEEDLSIHCIPKSQVIRFVDTSRMDLGEEKSRDTNQTRANKCLNAERTGAVTGVL